MGSCIICGKSVDGRICDLHEEDAVFEFRGSSPEELTIGRFYHGTVDGYAEFGVFVDIGDRVTGLLHRSELEQRLESLDWEPGDTVFVQVKQVRDNGNVDLGWSIRQTEREFRGTLVDDPDQGASFIEDEGTTEDSPEPSVTVTHTSSGTSERGDERGAAAAETAESDRDATGSDAQADETAGPSDPAAASEIDSQPTSAENEAEAESVATGETETGETETGETETGETATGETATGETATGETATEPAAASVEELPDRVGDVVRIEGVVEDVHQTSGPTVFRIRDETGAVECAAFEEAGVRAYPEVDADDAVRLDGEVRERHGDLQVETEALVVLEGEERDAVEDRLVDALRAEAEPDAVEPLAPDETVEALAGEVREVATAIRQAVLEERPVVVRHTATADGYVAGVALERATLPLVKDQHTESDAVYHYFDRRPLEEGVYDMDDATKDVTRMLDARERHGEKLPLFVFVAVGATRESLDGFELLDLYGADRALVSGVAVDPEIEAAVGPLVASESADAPETTATTLASNVAAHVDDDVRGDLAHLPAVSFWEGAPEAYAEAAADAGYDDDATRELRQAVALEAFYQSYEDKRELITDLLFGGDGGPGGLAGHVSEQFREKLGAEAETAEANLDYQTLDGIQIAILDTEAFTHRYEFPPVELLLDELHRRHREEADAVIGVAEDELHLRSDRMIDVRDVADRVSEWVPDAGVTARSAHEGKLEFLAGERSAVLDAVVDVVADELA